MGGAIFRFLVFRFSQIPFFVSLLQSAADMHPPSESKTSSSSAQQHSIVKRLSYVKTVVRMLCLCGGTKYQQLLNTKEGLSSYHSAVNDLLHLIERVCQGKTFFLL